MTEEDSSLHILVADDEENIRKIIETLFTSKSYRVTCTNNGFGALKVLQTTRVDVMVLDLRMPGMDGMELLSRIRDISADIPVVVITGYADVDTTAKALKSGASDFLPKPFGAQDILHSVTRLLELRKVRDENRKVLPFFNFRVTVEMPSETGHVNGVIHYLTEHVKDIGLCEPAFFPHLNIAIYEALLNAIMHGNGGDPNKKVRITADICHNKVKFIISDEGSGFSPDEITNRAATKNLYRIGGRGIYLMKSFMDEVRFNDIGNEITMIKRRSINTGNSTGEAR